MCDRCRAYEQPLCHWSVSALSTKSSSAECPDVIHTIVIYSTLRNTSPRAHVDSCKTTVMDECQPALRLIGQAIKSHGGLPSCNALPAVPNTRQHAWPGLLVKFSEKACIRHHIQIVMETAASRVLTAMRMLQESTRAERPWSSARST